MRNTAYSQIKTSETERKNQREFSDNKIEQNRTIEMNKNISQFLRLKNKKLVAAETFYPSQQNFFCLTVNESFLNLNLFLIKQTSKLTAKYENIS